MEVAMNAGKKFLLFMLVVSFLLSFSFFVRAPVEDSIRSNYSFVHMLFIMLAAVDYGGNTISSGAGRSSYEEVPRPSLPGRDHRAIEPTRSRTSTAQELLHTLTWR